MDDRIMNLICYYGSSTFHGIPNFSRYSISRNGDVIEHGTMELVKPFVSNGGYLTCVLTNDHGKDVLASVHRLLAIVYIPAPGPIENLIVNHRDGVKLNIAISNLEWTTYRGNAIHAGYLRLTEKCTPLLVRDVATGKVEEYPSLVSYANYSGMSRDAIAYRAKTSGQRIFPEMKQYKLKFDSSDWLIPVDIDCSLSENGTEKNVLIRDVITDNVMEFG